MIIGYDAKRAFLNRSGLGNYARNLITSAASSHPANQYLLFTPETGGLFSPISEIVRPTGVSSFFKGYWRSYGITNILNERKVDIYHGLSNELPFNISKFKGRKVVTIHDVIFKRYPEWYPATDRVMYDLKSSSACKNADVVICISEQTKKDVIRFYGVEEDKIVVLYQQLSPLYFEEPDETELKAIREKFKLDEPFVLYVGTVEERKDLLTLIKAYQQVSPEMKLVVAGKRKKDYRETVDNYIEENKLAGNIQFVEGATDSELRALYKLATVFVYPSRYEGWGLPVCEALTQGTPVITTRATTMEEAGADACLYFNAGDEIGLAEQIQSVIADKNLRKNLKEKGIKRSMLFHPKTCVEQLFQLYSVLQGR